MARSKKDRVDNTIPVFGTDGKIDAGVYNDIARCATLLSIQLIESNFNISPDFYEDNFDKDFKIEVENLHESFDQESRIVTCIFQLENYLRRSRKKVFSIKDKFIVFYHVGADCDDFHALTFARRTGFMAVYPFFRAHVGQTASLASAEIPILPVVASMPLTKETKRKEV